MATKSSIEWTESTWNPLTGCDKISPGCKHCYAERMAKRLKAMGQRNYRNEFELTLHPHVLEVPLRWKQPQMIFVNSMSDLFHERVPEEYIQRVFATMRSAHWHQFQVLTKRSKRLREMAGRIDWPANVWMGVSVENAKYTARIADLRATPAKIRFLSLEPLIGEIGEIDLDGIDWVIVGGESGPKARHCNISWIRSLLDQCLENKVSCFIKQLGSNPVYEIGDRLVLQSKKGNDMEEWPNGIRVRQLPEGER